MMSFLDLYVAVTEGIEAISCHRPVEVDVAVKRWVALEEQADRAHLHLGEGLWTLIPVQGNERR